MQVISHYEVKNRITGKVTTYKSDVAASRACDRADNAYGAVICSRRAIWVDAPSQSSAA